jgi:histidinol-phosphate/aromatic aminotransferase/cobyric acid decarboxylase-like protein
MTITGEDTEERAALEVSYLRQILETYSPGRRIVDVGCGLGRRAVRLARAGFEVTGLEVAELLEDARAHGERSGVNVRWEVIDPLAIADLPLSTVDAAIYIPRPDSQASVNQRRLLRRIRHHLADNGVLVAVYSPLLTVLSSSTPPASAPVSDVRLCSEISLSSPVKKAGFAIECIDADFTPGLSVTSESETIQIVARPLCVPPDSLAVTSWRNPESVRLDMRYAPDEDELLDPSPRRVWEELILSANRNGADIVNHYPVDDPYGSERGIETVSRFFNCEIEPRQLTFGAGVTSLLHDLYGLADGGLIYAPELVHGDLEAWALATGNEVRLFPEPTTAEQLTAELEAIRPALLHLDRPNFLGQVLSLDEMEEVIKAAARVGALVLIDESPAPYLGPAGSAARLVSRVDNLIVLRGFTKAYSWGGLRAGFALASRGVARHVRELVSPLQVSELALHAALKLLAAGDIFERLRERIRLMKPQAIELLTALGLDVIEGHDDLPWVAFSDANGEATRILEHCGICALRPAMAPVFPQPSGEFARITIPLSSDRLELFRELLSTAYAGRVL